MDAVEEASEAERKTAGSSEVPPGLYLGVKR